MILGCMALPNPVNAQSFFSAKLSASQETHDVVSDGRGTAALALTDTGLRFLVSVEELSGPIVAAHFHNGPVGEDGNVVRAIIDDFTGNTASGIWTATDGQPLTDELIQSLLAGNLYLNVHTAANGAGEIRGQVQISAGTQLGASLTAAQETHDVVSNALGTSSVLLTDAGVAFNITVEGLSGPIAAAHFHNGPAGEDGGIVRTLTGDFTGNTASGLWTASDGQPLTDELIQSLLAGDLYINVHTAANGAGEIRGQVRTSSGWGFGAMLNA
ncbi:MAG: CHRD domain-containing protein, partial [Bacteroidetes bacterium]|nr:CHRD domain-containing protein [Bacteroidota bacterium]